jgi:hypothetical protein
LKWFYRTNLETSNKIREMGFHEQLFKEGKWGQGIYFSEMEHYSKEDKSILISAYTIEDSTVYFRYKQFIKLFPFLKQGFELGAPQLKELVLSTLGATSVAIEKENGQWELCVYKPEHITIDYIYS